MQKAFSTNCQAGINYIFGTFYIEVDHPLIIARMERNLGCAVIYLVHINHGPFHLIGLLQVDIHPIDKPEELLSLPGMTGKYLLNFPQVRSRALHSNHLLMLPE